MTKPPTKEDSKDGEDVLNSVFAGARDPELADIVVYFRKLDEAPLVFLMQGEKMRRVLDRETQAWVVTLVENDGTVECPTVHLKLEGIGGAQLEAGLSVDGAMAAMLMRKDMDHKSLLPVEAYSKTEARKLPSLGRTLCVGVKRFELSPNSLNRLIVSPGKAEEDAKPQKIEIVKIPGNVTGQPLVSDCQPPPCPSHQQDTHDGGVQDGGSCRVDGGAERDTKPNSLPVSFFNFANSRMPLHLGSIAIGFHPIDFHNRNHRWCWQAGWCRPSLYVFGNLHTWSLGADGPDEWSIPPALSISPVVGVRLLDPAFGDVVVGARIGAEDRLWLRSLSRFGIIAGLSYVFEDATPEKAIGDQPEQRSSLERWRLFTAVDFAF